MAKDEEKVVAAEGEPTAQKPAAKKAAEVTAEKPAEDKIATEVKEEVKESAASEKAEAVVEQKTAPEAKAPAAAPAASAAPRHERTERSYGGGDNRSYGDRRGGPRQRRRKVCQFCVDRQEFIDYKDTGRLRKFISERAKIIPRRVTGTCARHQRELTTAIKNARQVALLPYISD